MPAVASLTLLLRLDISPMIFFETYCLNKHGSGAPCDLFLQAGEGGWGRGKPGGGGGGEEGRGGMMPDSLHAAFCRVVRMDT